jgi:hypothetical protein
VVVIEAFQMLCPGCVAHGLPLAGRIQATFGNAVTVIGLHTVFEHHTAMSPVALAAFLSEYRITFPVGVDRPSPNDPIPVTMGRYQLKGTPSLVAIGRDGTVRHHSFGQVSDLEIGATLARLTDEDLQDCDAHTGCRAPSKERQQ